MYIPFIYIYIYIYTFIYTYLFSGSLFSDPPLGDGDFLVAPSGLGILARSHASPQRTYGAAKMLVQGPSLGGCPPMLRDFTPSEKMILTSGRANANTSLNQAVVCVPS